MSRPAAIGILGGTFDPVHYGHLRAAVEVRERLGLSEMRMLPSARPPHRPEPGVTAEHRLEMLRRAIAGQPGLVADDSELRREGPSWMVDTLAGFRRELGEDVPLVLVTGQDAANGLDRWHRWRDLFDLAHIAVMRRPESRSGYADELAVEMRRRRASEPGELHEAPHGRVLPLQITQLEISSTRIRELCAKGRSAAFLAPPAVIEYIEAERLYGVRD